MLEPQVAMPLRADDPSAAVLEVACPRVSQRNWSRVATGTTRDGRGVFLKQFVDRRGEWHEDHWRYEAEGVALARRTLRPVLGIPPLLERSTESLTLVYEDVHLVAVDDLLREDPEAFEAAYDGLLAKLRALLERLASGVPQDSAGLSVKHRPYGGPADALCFKGLDVRNLGFGPDRERLWGFDFGRPYLSPAVEPGAKLFVSIGLLNWGRPLGRFLRGPSRPHLARAAEALAPFLDRDAVRAEVALQRAVRTHTFQGGCVESALKRWGVRWIGRGYLRELERMCAEVLA